MVAPFAFVGFQAAEKNARQVTGCGALGFRSLLVQTDDLPVVLDMTVGQKPM